MTVCERIDALLQERNMSRRQLAIKAEIAPSSLQSAMQRNTTLSLDMLFPISEVLGVDVDLLANGYRPDDDIPEEEKERMLEEGAQQHLAELENERLNGKQLSCIPIVANWDKLNTAGQREAIKRVNELMRLAEYQRKIPIVPSAEDQEGNSSTTQEKPPEGH